VTLIERDRRSAPPLPRERRRSASRRWHWRHDDKRVLSHRHGRLDPERVWLVNVLIALPACWTGMFGNAHSAMDYRPRYTARIIRFPERRSDIAKLRSEIAAMMRTVSVG
jgi:hypothetical protein